MFSRIEKFNPLESIPDPLDQDQNLLARYYTIDFSHVYDVHAFRYTDYYRPNQHGFYLNVTTNITTPIYGSQEVLDKMQKVNYFTINTQLDKDGNIKKLKMPIRVRADDDAFSLTYRKHPFQPNQAYLSSIRTQHGYYPFGIREFEGNYGSLGQYPRKMDWLGTLQAYLTGRSPSGLRISGEFILRNPLIPANKNWKSKRPWRDWGSEI